MPGQEKIVVQISAATDVGLVRQNNEDNFLILDLSRGSIWTASEGNNPPEGSSTFEIGENGLLLAVSDGMGGALAGEVASHLAVKAVASLMRKFQGHPQYALFPFSERLRLAIEQANALIYEKSRERIEFTGMGATFTAAAFYHGLLYLGQVGDSRAYILRSNQMQQMTKDQSLVHHLMEAGYLTPDQAERHAYKNVILQALGAHPNTVIIVDRVQLFRDDYVLVCSDGLSNKVSAQEMAAIISGAPDLASASTELIRLANERGGEDNITLVLARFSGDGLPPASEAVEPIAVRIERDERLPESVEPELLEDESLSIRKLASCYSEEETEEPDEANGADAPDGAEPNDPVGPEEIQTEELAQVRPGSLIGRRVSIALLVILFFLFIGAILSAIWYLKTRSHPTDKPVEKPVLAAGALVALT